MTASVETTMNNETVIARISIKINGTAASEEVIGDIVEVLVDQNINLPSMFSITLNTRGMQSASPASFAIADEIEIGIGQSTAQSLLKGEVTAIELHADNRGQSLMTIRGFDNLHRLQRGRKTRTFADVSLSDLVTKLAREAGISADATSTSPTYKYVLQNNETNFEFLNRRASRVGMELYASGNKLKLCAAGTTEGPEVKWGQDLRQLTARKSAYDPVDGVIVRGWDEVKKEAIVGTASGASGPFNASKLAAVYHPVKDQGEATKIAKAIQDDMKSRELLVEGTCLGNPTIKAGTKLKISGVSAPFASSYYLTSTSHRYSREGYMTHFQASGTRPSSLFELTGHDHPANQFAKVPGFMIGIVTNLNDPDGMGRVKVKLPTLPQDEGKDIESNWARMVSPMAGASRGLYILPEVNDEVLVGFELGDPARPFVMGALWNGKDAPPESITNVVKSGKVNQRWFKTRVGHTVIFDDSDDKPGITIVDKTAKNKIFINTKDNLITIESDKDITFKATNGKITLDAKDVDIKGSTSAKITSKAVDLDAQQDVTIKGGVNAKMSGNMVEVKGSASGKFDGGGMAEIKGGMVKIN